MKSSVLYFLILLIVSAIFGTKDCLVESKKKKAKFDGTDETNSDGSVPNVVNASVVGSVSSGNASAVGSVSSGEEKKEGDGSSNNKDAEKNSASSETAPSSVAGPVLYNNGGYGASNGGVGSFGSYGGSNSANAASQYGSYSPPFGTSNGAFSPYGNVDSSSAAGQPYTGNAVPNPPYAVPNPYSGIGGLGASIMNYWMGGSPTVSDNPIPAAPASKNWMGGTGPVNNIPGEEGEEEEEHEDESVSYGETGKAKIVAHDDNEDMRTTKSDTVEKPTEEKEESSPVEQSTEGAPAVEEEEEEAASDDYKPGPKTGLVSDGACEEKKVIVLEADASGMANRLQALVSAIALAVAMDRVLYLKWDQNAQCGAKFEELFNPKKPSRNKRVFFYEKFRGLEFLDRDREVASLSDSSIDPTGLNKTRVPLCKIHLTQNDGYKHFWLLGDDELYKKLDDECYVIHIHSNQYFIDFLTAKKVSGHLTVQDYLSNPFQHISKCALVPKPKISRSVEEFVKTNFKSKKWMSLHARGYFTDEKAVEKSMDCANALVKAGVIDKLLFTTDSEKLQKIAVKYMDKKNLVLQKKSLVKRHQKFRIDSHDIRDEMDVAVKEWYLIGMADYCSSTAWKFSSFSQSAIARGDCKMVDMSSGDLCVAAIQQELDKKMESPVTRRFEDMKKDKVERRKIWDTVKRYHIELAPLCIPKGTESAVLDYWASCD